jgi:hypothetical protein
MPLPTPVAPVNVGDAKLEMGANVPEFDTFAPSAAICPGNPPWVALLSMK